MEEHLKVDKDYLEAFNLGYELAKELKLKSPMFKNIESDISRIHTLQMGMEEYCKEITLNKNITLDDSKIIQQKNKDNQDGNELSL
ncbi:hypothetical protein QSE00_09925 [Arenibacter sp. M-2]|uniref:hypothetical protein n=1 Tax=Arenibacter sp. M-2 TaxID=3053612 RepID=UPI00256FD047|nr:hypothetical protein [Arenibacter sp. M-2]MDL5512131.1 hypothetical protein [Arenibacter sp. M-2]